MFKRLSLIILSLIISSTAFAQVTPEVQRYRNDEKGNIQYRREGIMDGNLVRTIFYNNGEVGQWPFEPSGEWPKGSGHSYLDGVAVLIGAEFTAPGNGQVMHSIETSYREWVDKDPVTGKVWGLEPVPGYINPSSTTPAINTHPDSWPSVWPDALGLRPDWNGYWYGYFGKGVQNADFETFFVMDDSQDDEFTRPPYLYYPIASDSGRGGIGIRVEVRGFQWSHVLAEDNIFWHYDITNISDHNYEKAAFGFYTDPGVGGTNDSGDDNASFSLILDIAYAYDTNGKGLPDNWKTGYMGYAYLESPGNSTNGIDDDQDGMVDESRDDNIDNNHNWVSFSDLNNNGKWDPKEPLNDDVGEDGIGPWDIGYNGPDLGEGDGKPTHGEPHFDETDKDESDQIGLTSLSIYRLGEGGTGGGWPKDDEPMWQKMNYHNFDTTLHNSNISMVFASGPFPLNVGQRERFSMALVFGTDLDNLIFHKETVQEIYNANYNFSKPPLKPTLTAVAGNHKVFLYWNNISEQSRDPFLGFENNDPTQGYKKDFEGYLIYRSTEAEFNDIKTITDSKGAPTYWKPIAQFDLKDSIAGPDPVGINGASFWRGSNTGLAHSFVDTNIVNGQRYFYAVCAYDMGDPNFGSNGLQPTENSKVISSDYSGNIKFVDINCAVVTPNAPAAGYTPAQIIGNTGEVSSGVGTGSMTVNILNPDTIRNGATYKVIFNSAGTYPTYKTSSFDVVRTYNGSTDTLLTNVDSSYIGADRVSAPFDGMTVGIINDTTINVIDTSTGWLVGNSNLEFRVTKDNTSRSLPYPADYEIDFSDTPQDTTFFNFSGYPKMPVNFKITNLTEGQKAYIAVQDVDNSKSLTPGDTILILEFIGNPSVSNSRIAYHVSYGTPADPSATPVEPKAGDKFIIKTSKPFMSGDYFSFSTKPYSTDGALAKSQLSDIKVVPNPYIAADKWEPKNLNYTGRGERRIEFTHLPAKCTIRIYTMAGALIKTLYKDSGPTNGGLFWDLVTEDGMDAAFGIYIYHVDAPGVGEHIGKFALIK